MVVLPSTGAPKKFVAITKISTLHDNLLATGVKIIVMPGAQKPRTLQSVINDLIGRVNTDTRRLRVIEQEIDIFKSRMAALEQTMTDHKKAVNATVTELRVRAERSEDKVARMESLLTEMAKAMKKFAPASEIKKLEQLIEIYSTLKSEFMTREQVEELVDEKLGQKA